MKKILFSLTLITSILFTAQAGYVIRGINTSIQPSYLKNFTLTFNASGEPVSAGSMIHPIYPGNSIVIINAYNNLATFFPVLYGGEDLYIEVRDFHYIPIRNIYVLCGSRGEGVNARAFVAVINISSNMMLYNEYPEADIFYSIWTEDPLSAIVLDYFACGKVGQYGVIASIDRSTLQCRNFYKTDNNWEYHKIISQDYSPIQHYPRIVASGRNPDCTHIGFTTIDPQFFAINTYMWGQRTDPLSHCVVSGDVLAYNSVILASSYQNTVTLNPVTYPILTPTVDAYNFILPANYRYSVQDIGTIQVPGNNFRISVAGFKSGLTAQTIAWHGYVIGLSSTVPMRNNDYNRPFIGRYEHYKIRHLLGNEFTGGYFQTGYEMCALFGTPLIFAEDCEARYLSDYPRISRLPWTSFNLSEYDFFKHSVLNIPQLPLLLPVFEDCSPFKEGDFVPELIMPEADEGEIITFYDRITVKDISMNTNYQIYNMVGQLIQMGTTNPDISIVNFNKGIYILRLENGKSFKFVK